jgi:hypothetical protein
MVVEEAHRAFGQVAEFADLPFVVGLDEALATRRSAPRALRRVIRARA